jgi:predicted ATP-binding protein involved in virulence
MRLTAKMFEDSRGRRSIDVVLYLGGPFEPPADLAHLTQVPLTKRVDVDRPKAGVGSHRDLAGITVTAPEDLDAATFQSVREELEQSGKNEHRLAKFDFWSASDVPETEKASIFAQLLDAISVRLKRRERRTDLRILRLDLEDFRGIDRMNLVFSPNQTTVLIGANGCGKTTLLNAAVLLLSYLRAGITQNPRKIISFTDADVMNGRGGSKLSIKAVIGGNSATWSVAHDRGGEPLPADERLGLLSLDEEVRRLHSEIDKGDICLPLIVYYPVNRAVLDIPLRIRTQHTFEPFEAYDGALVADQRSFRLFFEWFRGREDLENELRIHDSAHRDHQLEAVRRAVASLMPGFTNLRVQRSPLGMIVEKGDWTLNVEQLSDGEKCLLAMTGDLARRLAMANPFMDNPLKGGGIVLIDEIELHLHPSWQREVIPALERTFPHCQFVVTTHSPAVVGHVQRESLFLLKPEKTGIRAEQPSVSLGLDANRVLLEIMGVDERPHDFKVKLELIFTLLGAGNLEEARREIANLEAQMGSEPELTKAMTMIRRKELIGR